MKESLKPKTNSVMVLSTAAATGHLRAADALVAAFAARGVFARHVEVLRYMAAADLLVGKPGGLTSSEALARGLVLVIINPIPGQEERNSDHFLEEGVEIRCNNLPALAYKIDTLLADPGRFSRMREAAKRMARPNAASEVVSTVLKVKV